MSTELSNLLESIATLRVARVSVCDVSRTAWSIIYEAGRHLESQVAALLAE